MNTYKVLFFTDSDEGRDVEIAIPIIYFMEKYLNCKVEFRFLWDLDAIRSLKPDMVLLPNSIGHHLYTEAAWYCQDNKIPCFAMESEGNFRTDGSFEYGGYNKGKKIPQEWLCCWSERAKSFLSNLYPQELEKLVVTGGPGFDRYVAYPTIGKEKFLTQYNKEGYTKIIGYAGWAFGRLFTKRKHHFFGKDEEYVKGKMDWLHEQRIHVREVLREAIINNPDTLFILKRHPKEFFEHEAIEQPNEMNELVEYDNVLYFTNSEPLQNLINVCDLWTGFETTTCMEAWLMNKQTILINSDPVFPRAELHKGSVKAEDYGVFQKQIDSFYTTGNIEGFDELQQERHELMTSAIGFFDGFNHIRTGYYIQKTLDKIDPSTERKYKVKAKYLKYKWLYHIGKLVYNKGLFLKLPKFRKTIFIFERWNLPRLSDTKLQYEQYLDTFYKENVSQVEVKNPDWWSQYIKEPLDEESINHE